MVKKSGRTKPRKSLTVLHLSDLQFGVNHRFAGVEITGMANPHDTLLAPLQEDLWRLMKEEHARPDIVVVTGDLAEFGKPSEFALAREFLDRLIDREHLNLPRERVAIIPGNHDINRSACLAYFADCAAKEARPVPPWWPKWRIYAEEMFSKFYGGKSHYRFTEEQPWTFFEIPDLHVVIAGLNSTMADGHSCQQPGVSLDPTLPRHVGFCGEDQLKSAQGWLRDFREDGWFRIVMVHHNVEPDVASNGNLEDTKNLKRLLAPYTNLLLHGHTHEAELGWLDNVCPVLGTGSASLKSAQRPDEIPNQYQIIELSAGQLRVFKRCYFPERREWGIDARVGKNGLIEKSVHFATVRRAFVSAGGTQLSSFIDTYLNHVSRLPVLSGLFNPSRRSPVQDSKAMRVSVLFREVLGNDLVSRRQPGATLSMHSLLREMVSGEAKVAMLLGVAGVGKTTACKRFLVRLASVHGKMRVIPVYVPLSEYAADRPFVQFLDRKINEVIGHSRGKAFKRLRDETTARGLKMLLILDGWNEQSPEALRQIQAVVRPLLADGATRVLVTSRPVVSTDTAWLGDEVRFFELQKWTDRQLKTYFRRCGCAKVLPRLPASVRHVLKLPFLAFLFVSVLGPEQNTPLPVNTAGLLGRVIKNLLGSLQQAQGRSLPVVPEAVAAKVPKALQNMAHLMTSMGVLQMQVKLLRKCFRAIRGRAFHDVMAHLINSGILRSTGEPLAFQIQGRPGMGEGVCVAFIHQIFQEYLTAEYVRVKSPTHPRALLPENPSTDVFWMDVPMYVIQSLRNTATAKEQQAFVRSFLTAKGGKDLLTPARLVDFIDDGGLRDQTKAELIQRLRGSLEASTPYSNIIKAFLALGDEGLAAVRSCLTRTQTQIDVYAIAEAQNLGYRLRREFEIPWRRLGRSIYLLGELGDVQLAREIERRLPQIRSLHLLYHVGEALLTLVRQSRLSRSDKALVVRCALRLERMPLRDPVTEAYACAIMRECGRRASNLTERTQTLAAFLKEGSETSDRRFRSGFWRRAHGCEAFAEVASAQECASALADLFAIEDSADYGDYEGGDYGAVHSSILKAVGRSCSRWRKERRCWRPLMQAVFKSRRVAENGWACNHLERILASHFDQHADVEWLRDWKNSRLLGGKVIRVVLSNVLKDHDAP